MNKIETIEKLSDYNRWRLGAEIPQPSPEEITLLINQAIIYLKEVNL